MLFFVESWVQLYNWFDWCTLLKSFIEKKNHSTHFTMRNKNLLSDGNNIQSQFINVSMLLIQLNGNFSAWFQWSELENGFLFCYLLTDLVYQGNASVGKNYENWELSEESKRTLKRRNKEIERIWLLVWHERFLKENVKAYLMKLKLFGFY